MNIMLNIPEEMYHSCLEEKSIPDELTFEYFVENHTPLPDDCEAIGKDDYEALCAKADIVEKIKEYAAFYKKNTKGVHGDYLKGHSAAMTLIENTIAEMEHGVKEVAI